MPLSGKECTNQLQRYAAELSGERKSAARSDFNYGAGNPADFFTGPDPTFSHSVRAEGKLR